jgi:hypothetical protein
MAKDKCKYPFTVYSKEKNGYLSGFVMGLYDNMDDGRKKVKEVASIWNSDKAKSAVIDAEKLAVLMTNDVELREKGLDDESLFPTDSVFISMGIVKGKRHE